MIGALALGLLASPQGTGPNDLNLDWSVPNRVWVGPQLWANRLQDWRVKGGRLECTAKEQRLGMRTVHVLTHRLQEAHQGAFSLRASLGRVGVGDVAEDSAAGLLLGAGGEGVDWRAAALVHGWSGPGGGLFFGIDATGTVFVRDNATGELLLENSVPPRRRGHYMRILAVPYAVGAHRIEVIVDGRSAGLVALRTERVVGGIALVSHPGTPDEGKKGGRWWFDDVELFGGDVVAHHPDRTLGPILSVQHTRSRDVLKLTAQFMPIGREERRTAQLNLTLGDCEWGFGIVEIVEPGFTATFRVDAELPNIDLPYRVTWAGSDYEGVIPKDPTAKEELVLAGLNCNHNNSHKLGSKQTDWTNQVWFPHADLVANVAAHEPDLLFFAGDQVYEGKSPTFADRANLELDYLYKWYLWCWAYRDLTRNIPTVTIPDDHDVYQGNIWGEGGRPAKRDHFGGYVHPASFVKMVERTQTSHLPDPFDATPIEQGIGVYTTSLLLGGVDFAILADRKFKSGPAGKGLPETGTKRPDHVDREQFDPREYDREDLVLLGARQLAFLDQWAQDWDGVEMKAVFSQTPFANLATHHGAGLQYLQADLDSNGWPQSGRDRALRAIRAAFAFHVSGDQHLATLVQHGVDDFGDAAWSYCVPSVANFYPRAWRPEGGPLGNHLDGLGNRVTVHAVANPGVETGREPADLYDKMPGYGIVRMNVEEHTITFECWPRHVGPGGEQYEGWPRTIRQSDNAPGVPESELPWVR